MPPASESKKSARTRVKSAARAFHAVPTARDCSTSSSAGNADVDEDHPTGPFVHAESRVLICGTFPPVKKSIHFYYPNSNNDMWRVLGEVFFRDRERFYTSVMVAKPGHRRGQGTLRAVHGLNESAIRTFAASESIGFFDVCKRIHRHRGNSSDDNLETLERTDVFPDVLAHTPHCDAIVTTGTLALTMLLDALHPYGTFRSANGEPVEAVARNKLGKTRYDIPHMGGKLQWIPHAAAPFQNALWIYRAPSTSRALPMKLEDKVAQYRTMFGAHLNLAEDFKI